MVFGFSNIRNRPCTSDSRAVHVYILQQLHTFANNQSKNLGNTRPPLRLGAGKAGSRGTSTTLPDGTLVGPWQGSQHELTT